VEQKNELDEIAEENVNRLYAHAYMLLGSKHDAEDAAEEAIYRLYCRTKPFADREHARAWLVRVTVNAALKMLRRRKFLSDKEIDETDIASADFEYPEQSDIITAVRELPIKYRTVILLHYYEDISTKEIARTLKIPQSTVTTRLSRGRALLREKLKGEYEYEF